MKLKKHSLYLLFLGTMCLLIASPKTIPSNEEIEITADEANITYESTTNNTTITYNKNVFLTWKKTKLKTETLKLSIDKNKETHISCPQKLYLTYEDLSIEADHAHCTVESQVLTLYENITIRKKNPTDSMPETSSTAHRMIINLKNQKTTLFGKEKEPIITKILLKSSQQ